MDDYFGHKPAVILDINLLVLLLISYERDNVEKDYTAIERSCTDVIATGYCGDNKIAYVEVAETCYEVTEKDYDRVIGRVNRIVDKAMKDFIRNLLMIMVLTIDMICIIS